MISVCMATYNGEKYIKEQLNSILLQLNECDEIIVSDDGSTDNTLNVVNSIKDDRIKVIYNVKEHGYTGNFYNALKEAQGEFILLSDQDDIWLPQKVKVTIEYLHENDFVISDASIVKENLEVIEYSRFKVFNVRKGFINNLVHSRYLGCCMAFNRKVLKCILPPPTYKNKYPHDLWIALVSEKYFKCELIEDPLILYRRHEDNASDGGYKDKKNRSLIVKIFSRVYYLFEVLRIRKRINRS